MISQRLAELFTGYNWMIIPAAFLTIVLHEMAHGFVAYLLGDRTAKDAGRLTLNPIKHIDIWGLLAMVIFRFGWAKPVPVNPYYFKNRKSGMLITAIAGPVCNILLAILGLVVLKLFDGASVANGGIHAMPKSEISLCISTFFAYFVILNVALAVFNMLPVPPLDGSKVLNAILPERMYFGIMQYERYGFIVLLLLINIPFVQNIIGDLQESLLNILSYVVGL